jgi:hypothetical protein
MTPRPNLRKTLTLKWRVRSLPAHTGARSTVNRSVLEAVVCHLAAGP